MTTDHPAPELLDRLAAGRAVGEEARWAVEHLVRRCDICLRHVRAARERQRSAGRMPSGAVAPAGMPGSPEEEVEIGAYDEALVLSMERTAARAAGVRAQQLEATALWARIEAAPPERRAELVASDPAFHTWAVASRLLEEAAEFHWRDTGWEIEGCRLALLIAELLPRESCQAGLFDDLRARALGGLADALRQGGELPAAEETLERAWEALEVGSGDPLERAALLRLAANLWLSLGEFGAAAALLWPAAGIYRLYGERHQQGRTPQKLALAVGFEDPPQGVRIAERALALIERGREPRVELAARHLLVWFLNDCGLPWEALALLERSRLLYRQCGDSEPLALLPWVEARICRRLGRLDAAERGLSTAWHRCWAEDWHKEQTLVSLDLTEALLAQGKDRRALRMLGSGQESLRRWGMHGEGLAAWRMALNEAEEAVNGTGGREERTARARAVLAEVALYFRRAWRRELPFRGITC